MDETNRTMKKRAIYLTADDREKAAKVLCQSNVVEKRVHTGYTLKDFGLEKDSVNGENRTRQQDEGD